MRIREVKIQSAYRRVIAQPQVSPIDANRCHKGWKVHGSIIETVKDYIRTEAAPQQASVPLVEEEII